jgi:hypothetical protein
MLLMVRTLPFFVSLLVLISPARSNAQSFVLHGSAGPTLFDRGHSLAAGIGFSPISRITVSFDVARTHLSSRLRSDGRGGTAGFRGGTLTTGAAELRVSLFPHDRVGPYGIAGFAMGVSKPNVNDMFPDPVTNDVRAAFFGGGISVPIRRNLNIFGDVRAMVGSEAGELLAVSIILGGVTYRF